MFFVISLCFLVSCASVPDVPIFIEKSMDRGTGVTIVSGVKFDVDDEKKFEDKTWYEQRNEMLRLPVSSWVKLKAFIVKMCKKYKCDQEISSWDKTVEAIDNLSNQNL